MQMHQPHAIVGLGIHGTDTISPTYHPIWGTHCSLIGREGVPGRRSLDGSTWKALHVIFPPLIIPFGWGSHG